MDILLSVPLISAFFTPSWTTSINILFFYATWSTLVLTHDPVNIHGVSLLTIRTFLWLIPSLIFLLFDSLLPSLAASIKWAGSAGLPSWTRVQSGKKGPARALRLTGLAVFNALLLTAAEVGTAWVFRFFAGHALFRTSTTLPLPWQIFKHIGILFTAREVLTYYTHRNILHGSGPLARLHTRWAHASGGGPSSLSLYADHPLPLLVLHVVPILLPSALLRPHFLTYLLFVVLVTGEGTMSHSGYSIVPGIILGGVARRTAIHFASGGEANFGAFGLLDFAHGTSQGKDVLEDVKDEAEKHDVKQRASNKVDEGTGLIQNSVEALTGSSSNGGSRRSGRKRTPKKAD
jgi:hypothetical protein